MTRHVEIAILGAGAVGTSIAFHLAQEGKNPLVIDRGFPGGGTSGATAAWVWVQTKTPDHYAQFTAASIDLYPILTRRLGMDIEYHRTGGISVAFSDTEIAELSHLADQQRRAGLPVSMLSREDTLHLEPALNPALTGAMYCPLDGNVNPFRLVSALRQGALAGGAEFWTHTDVIAIEPRGGRYRLSTSRGLVEAETLVLSAGPWSSQVGALLGITMPVKLSRGQMLVTEPLPPLVRHTIQGLRQQDNGEILFGYSHEEVGLDTRTTLEIIHEVAQVGVRLVPALRHVHIVRAFAGVRVIPNDGLPILGRIPGMDGAFIAVTHSGITLSPIIGEVMTELLVSGRSSVSLDPYAMERFTEARS